MPNTVNNYGYGTAISPRNDQMGRIKSLLIDLNPEMGTRAKQEFQSSLKCP